MKVYSIYRLTHALNGKMYIGYTSQKPIKRWSEHIRCQNLYDTKWYRALRKYGKKAFVLDCIYQTLDPSDAVEKEKYFIDQFDSIRKGYNTHVGGKGGNTGAYHKVGRRGIENPMFGRRWSDEEKLAIGLRSKQVHQNRSIKQKREIARKSSAAQKGKPKSPETLERIRESFKTLYRAHTHTVYELTHGVQRYTVTGKSQLVEFCKRYGLSVWTVERVLLFGKCSKGSCAGWSARVCGYEVF